MRFDGRDLGRMLLSLVLLSLGCREVVTAPTNLVYSTNPAVYIIGQAITANTPSHSGGDIDSYAVSPALPSGLSLDAKSGVISGTPTVAAAVATYTVTATNSEGAAKASLGITVTEAPSSVTITTQPANQSVYQGQTATFSVVATGTGILTYQWRKDGRAIFPSASSATYTTHAVTLADNGSTFDVVITDGNNLSLTSAAATLTVSQIDVFSSTTGGLGTGRTYHTATLLNTGKVLLAGGLGSSVSLGTAELYNPATGTFSGTGNLVNARQKHTATLLSDGRVLIVGGIAGAGGSTTLATAEIYNPGTGTFSLTTGNPVAARSEHTATLLPNGKVLIVSGRDQGNYVPTAELYDPVAGTFALTAAAPLSARANHTATLLNNGQVLIAGGYLAGALATAELYDPALDAFTATASMGTARTEHTATLLPSGGVLLVGGTAGLTAELFYPAAGTHGVFGDALGSLNTARVAGHTATLLASGKVLITGGRGTGSPAPVLADAELFDPSSETFTLTTGTMATAREHHGATLLPTGRVLISAGDAGGTPLASAETYF